MATSLCPARHRWAIFIMALLAGFPAIAALQVDPNNHPPAAAVAPPADPANSLGMKFVTID